MSESATSSLPFSMVRWLASHAGFPGARLPERAELLLCFATAAVLDEAGNGATGASHHHKIERRNSALDVSQRALALRRSRVHFKCDNSAKV
ncbi:hypothetical protein [Geminisphaera colitermitum]|uniref:hypothetical protein n=1 Tax=Geminisphaera colitermitum TaxID=1148786 RepID=UPI0005B9CFD3|nr:hypothetical protein [Geminisphaera colitermitum]